MPPSEPLHKPRVDQGRALSVAPAVAVARREREVHLSRTLRSTEASAHRVVGSLPEGPPRTAGPVPPILRRGIRRTFAYLTGSMRCSYGVPAHMTYGFVVAGWASRG